MGTDGRIGDNGAQSTGHAKSCMGHTRSEVQKAGIAWKTGHRPISNLGIIGLVFIWVSFKHQIELVKEYLGSFSISVKDIRDFNFNSSDA